METEFILGELNDLENLEVDDKYFVRIWPPAETQGDSTGETTDTVDSGSGDGREVTPPPPEVVPVTIEPVYVRLWPPLEAQGDSTAEAKDEN